MSKFKSLFVLLSVIFGLISVSVFIYCVFYFSNKGFEITDETYYLYFTEHPKLNIYLTQNFGILNNFACLGKISIINLRITKLVFQIVAITIFIYCLFYYIRKNSCVLSKYNMLLISVSIVMASFVNYDYLPMTLSYNTWTLILSLFCFSLIFIELINKLKTVQLLTSFGYGFLTLCLFLVKFPNSVIMIMIYVFINFMFNRQLWSIKIITFFSGILISYLIFINDYNHLLNIISNYKVALFDLKYMSTGSYLEQFKSFILLCYQLNYLSYLVIIILLTIGISKFNKSKNQIINYIPILLNLGFALLFFKGNSQNLYNDFMVFCLLILNGFIYIIFNKSSLVKINYFSEIHIISFILMVLPVGLMLGTNNMFYYTASQTMCFSLAGIILLMSCKSKIDFFYLPISSVFVCAFVFSVDYFGAVKTPYRQGNLFEKNIPIHFHPYLDGLYESKERFIDYSAMNSVINKLSPSTKKVVTFFSYMGLNYIANKSTFPECPLSDGENYIEADKYILKREHFNDSFELIVVPSKVYNNIKFKSMFAQYVVFFDKNYKLKFSYTLLSTKETVYFYKKNSL